MMTHPKAEVFVELERFWKVVPGRDALDHLTQPQAQAVFRLLMLASFADENVSDEERMTLAQALTRLPFFRPDEWRVFEHARGVQMLAHLRDRFVEEPAAVLGEIRAPLDEEHLRVLALRMTALFMQPDGYAEDEHAFCLTVGQAFGLDPEEVNVVLQDVVDWADAP